MSPRVARCIALWLWVAPVGSSALAQAPPDASPQSGTESADFFDEVWKRDYLLGFGPRRKAWEDSGINVDVYDNAYFGWNARGGQDTSDARRYSHSFDLFVRADTERMGLWSGGTALMQVKNNEGQNINPDVGGLSQVVDDADFDSFFYVDQLYYEQHWREERVRVRAGYLDYQTIIDRNAYANSEDVQFMNAALDNNPLVPLKIGVGATLFVDPIDWLGVILGTADAENEIRSAGLDTAFDGDNLMAYGEVTVSVALASARGELPGSYRWGAYHDPRRQPVYGEMRDRNGTFGTWLSFDQMVYRESESDRQGLGLFYRYAYREEDSYMTSQFHSGGLEYRGPLPGRDADAVGVGFYDLVPSDDYEDAVDSDFGGETGFESYYRIQMAGWLAITPGVQYIVDAGGLDSNRDALAVVLRTRIRF